eukprot:scaffold3474_cov148-Skeletonema_menzelii.AAC.2
MPSLSNGRSGHDVLGEGGQWLSGSTAVWAAFGSFLTTPQNKTIHKYVESQPMAFSCLVIIKGRNRTMNSKHMASDGVIWPCEVINNEPHRHPMSIYRRGGEDWWREVDYIILIE